MLGLLKTFEALVSVAKSIPDLGLKGEAFGKLCFGLKLIFITDYNIKLKLYG
jgi:hypothetical protein